MAKAIITLTDDYENGEPIVRGSFSLEKATNDEEGIAPNSQIVAEGIRRMWQRSALMPLSALVCQDMVARNMMTRGTLQAQKDALQGQKEAAASLPPLAEVPPANVTDPTGVAVQPPTGAPAEQPDQQSPPESPSTPA